MAVKRGKVEAHEEPNLKLWAFEALLVGGDDHHIASARGEAGGARQGGGALESVVHWKHLLQRRGVVVDHLLTHTSTSHTAPNPILPPEASGMQHDAYHAVGATQ